MRWVFKLSMAGIGDEWPELGKKGVLRQWHMLGVAGQCEDGQSRVRGVPRRWRNALLVLVAMGSPGKMPTSPSCKQRALLLL